MLIPWDQIALAAFLASLLALVMLSLVQTLRKSLPLPHLVGLTICAGLGLTLWFVIFNTFSLKSLDFDFPIPLFPVSPEDLGCMIVTALVAFIYWLVVKGWPGQHNTFSGKNQGVGKHINNPPQLEWWVGLLPALAALIIDVYFI